MPEGQEGARGLRAGLRPEVSEGSGAGSGEGGRAVGHGEEKRTGSALGVVGPSGSAYTYDDLTGFR